ncbi:MAG: pyridoxamine 5'-phosphate oxidase family protein [Arenimonas sp.]
MPSDSKYDDRHDATADSDTGLTSRPMSPLLLDAYGDLWFFTDIRSEKVKHLDAINLCFLDSTRATYVSLSGHGILHNERAYIDRLWTPFAKPWFAEGPESANLALLKFVTHSAEYWNSAQSRMVSIPLDADAAQNEFASPSRQSASA